MGTKNNPKNRKKEVSSKFYNEQEVEVVQYRGSHKGHGNYMAARSVATKQLIIVANKPLAWDQV